MDTRLDELRTRGAAAADPVRLRFIEAMARRAEAFDGAAREVLDTRVSQLVEAFLQALDTRAASPAETAIAAAAAAPSPLAELLGQLGQHVEAVGEPGRSGTHDHPGESGRTTQRPAADAAARARPSLAAPPELKAVRAFRGTWQRLAADQRLTQALAKVPDNAGPLHSHHLVHRALTLMRDTSPEYLQHFMAQVDALMWLEQAQRAPAAPTGPAGPEPR